MMSDDRYRIKSDWNGDYILEKDNENSGGSCCSLDAFNVIFGILATSPMFAPVAFIYSLICMICYKKKNGYNSGSAIFCFIASI